MKKVLQRIVFPQTDKIAYHYGLFYRGVQCAYIEDGDEKALMLAEGTLLDFSGYLNGFALNKWNLYTGAEKISLKLRLKGDCRIALTGYSLNPVEPERVCFSEHRVKADEITEFEFEYPESREEMLAFEITAFARTLLYGGTFSAEYEESAVKTVDLAIATTTCFKEPFIKGNIRSIRKELLESGDEIAQHLYVNVVDNGRTLTPDEIETDHVRLFPNPNTGGSGGFARGMMESLHMKENITHVLLMDDDVFILPESLHRTYTLLTLLKDEYKDAYISGAMLDYNKMDLQYEDVGSVNKDGSLLKAKPNYIMTDLANVLKNNREIPHLDHPYAAWWYCLIPRHMIEKNGLPMPFFIRGDDVEYGVRSHAKFLTMGGICVWHMGFANKYNAFMVMYQSLRNLMIVKASSDDIADCDVLGNVKLCFNARLEELAYDGAELVCRALEDFLKGPSFIASADGEAIMKEYRQLNEKMIPLKEIGDVEVRIKDDSKEKVYLPLISRVKMKLTFNGHNFTPEKALSDDIGVIDYDGQYEKKDIFFRKTLLAVNRYENTGAFRHFDKARYKQLKKRFAKDVKEYRERYDELCAAYRDAKKIFVTEEFWTKYLGLK